MPQRIIYEDLGALGSLQAEQLSWEQTMELAPSLMTITGDAYVAEFTHNLQAVPESDIRLRYNPENPHALTHF